MVVADTIKLLAGAALLTRSAIHAAYEYFKDEKATINFKPKGVGLDNDKPLPKDLPSAVDIKKKLPKHCFKSSVTTSLYYIVKDFALIAISFASVTYLHSVCPDWLYWPIMVLYWTVQGTMFTAIFVIGHDCGHNAFSKYPLLNEVAGQVAHCFLMCPYTMWKLTHRTHHRHTGNFEKDEVFYPVKKDEAGGKLLPGFGFGIGWFGYMLLGYNPRAVSHFNVGHKDFAGHTLACSTSLAVCTAWGLCLYRYASEYGAMAWFNYYFVPLFIFGSFCVIVTFLNHTEVNVPWYADDEWSFVRGQLTTIDRHYGIVHDLIHSIGTHQVHHMFPKIPHYHLEEATQHFRKNFPDLVRICDEPILPSFMRLFRIFEKQGIREDGAKFHIYHSSL